MSTVGLAIIARDEESRLPRLLESIEGAYDRIVLLDTGSKDDTVKVFVQWARKQTSMTFSVGDYEWCDDFGKARNHADRLLMYGDHHATSGTPMVDWTSWADCDDIIHGAQNIKPLCDSAAPDVAAFLVGYEYGRTAPDDGGEVVSYLWRERMVRAGQGHWHYRVHEAQQIIGGTVLPVDPSVLEWRHRKHDGSPAVSGSNGRNLRILKKWNEDEPNDPRILAYLGIESLIGGEYEDAIRYYSEYFALDPEWDDERAQAYRRFALALLHFERHDDMIATALEALHIHPTWPDTYLTLAEAYLAKGDAKKALHWANEAMTKGGPQGTLMVVNPMDYKFLPLKLAAGAHALLGNVEQALDLAMKALALAPDDALAGLAQVWQRELKKHQTADVFVTMAQQLIAHDEQLKALAILENAPWFCIDHPKLVAMRSMLRERMYWIRDPQAYTEHYTTGGSKPEDFEATGTTERVDEVCSYLPRAKFLLEGVVEQAHDA